MSDFDPDWPHGHVTRHGRPARIVCRDRKGYSGQKIVALYASEDGQGEVVATYCMNGRFSLKSDLENLQDLLNAPEPALADESEEDDSHVSF